MRICNIVGTITDSAGVGVNGTLQVLADAPVFDDSTTPDTIVTPKLATFDITAGVVDIDLPITAPSKVAVRFQFTPDDEDGYVEFKTSIPDQLTVELASLWATSFTTDRAVTGALRIAQEMLTNPTLVPYLTEGLGIIRSATPPPAPSDTSFVWFDTSSEGGVFYTFDGDNWLGRPQTQTLGVVSTAHGSVPTTITTPISTLVNTAQVYVDRVTLRWNVSAAPHDNSNRYSFRPGYNVTNSTTPTYFAAAFNSNPVGYSTGTMGTQVIQVEQTLNTNTLNNWLLTMTKTGTPGNLTVGSTVYFRAVVPPA